MLPVMRTSRTDTGWRTNNESAKPTNAHDDWLHHHGPVFSNRRYSVAHNPLGQLPLRGLSGDTTRFAHSSTPHKGLAIAGQYTSARPGTSAKGSQPTLASISVCTRPEPSPIP